MGEDMGPASFSQLHLQHTSGLGLSWNHILIGIEQDAFSQTLPVQTCILSGQQNQRPWWLRLWTDVSKLARCTAQDKCRYTSECAFKPRRTVKGIP